MVGALIAGIVALLVLGAVGASAALLEGTNRSERITGGARGDIIRAGSGNDVIRGRGGPDTIVAGRGNDRVFAQAGNDRVSGNQGNDRIDGGAANDRLLGGPGRDRLAGGGGNDVLNGGTGPDRLSGGRGADSLAGGAGRDRLAGGAGNDRLSGGPANDVMSGGTGRDRLVGGGGTDILVGGRGNDTILARDGRREVVRCGPGRDSAKVDFFERTITDCERVIRPPASRALSIGAPAQAFGGITLTVNSAAPNATQEVLAADPTNLPPPPGHLYVLANLTITNGTQVARPIEIGVIGADGNRVAAGERRCGVLAAPLPIGTLAPGEAVTGNVCWRMSFSDFGRMVLIVDLTGAIANGIAVRLG